ncbi:MAG: hypothetical protein WA738_02395 [Candidatus Angelobacter sp.]
MKISKCASFCFTAWLLIFSSNVIGQNEPAAPLHLAKAYHQGQFNALLDGGVQYWDHGYLIAFGKNGVIETSPSTAAVTLYNKQGQIAREAVVWIEDADLITLGDAAVTSSGKLVVSGGVRNRAGAIATFIAEIGDDGHVHRVIRTSPFSARLLCALDDGTVWGYGQDRDDHLANIPNSLRLREYSFEKGQLHAMLDTTALDPEGWLLDLGRYPGDINLRCNAKTVALYNGGSGDLIELDLRSRTMKVTKVAPLPPPTEFTISGFALTESGEIFAGFHDRTQKPQKPAISGLFRLSRDTAGGAKWVPVEGTVGPYLHGSPIQRLLGADGDDLVYSSLKDGRMFWSKQSPR